jgi:hypothetical protein
MSIFRLNPFGIVTDEGNTIFFSFRKLSNTPCVFYIKLSNDRTSATAYNYDPDDDEGEVNNIKIQKSLIVKPNYDNLYIYKNK